MTPATLARLRELMGKATKGRPLANDNSPEANAARSAAWALFDNAEDLLAAVEREAKWRQFLDDNGLCHGCGKYLHEVGPSGTVEHWPECDLVRKVKP